MRFIRQIALFLLSLSLIGSCLAEAGPKDSRLCYDDFKKLSNKEQITVFSSLTSPEIYYLVQTSETENWPVSGLELVGGCNQMNTVFSWGTLNSSGLISQAGTEEINCDPRVHSTLP